MANLLSSVAGWAAGLVLEVPYCIAINPDPGKQWDIITGHSNKKAVQWDVREAKIVQEYDEHLGAVNTVSPAHRPA